MSPRTQSSTLPAVLLWAFLLLSWTPVLVPGATVPRKPIQREVPDNISLHHNPRADGEKNDGPFPANFRPNYMPDKCSQTSLSSCGSLINDYTNCFYNDPTKVNDCMCSNERMLFLASCGACGASSAVKDITWLYGSDKKPEDANNLLNETTKACNKANSSVYPISADQVPPFIFMEVSFIGPIIFVGVFWSIAGFFIIKGHCMKR